MLRAGGVDDPAWRLSIEGWLAVLGEAEVDLTIRMQVEGAGGAHQHRVGTKGSSFDTVLFVSTSDCELDELACNDDDPAISTAVTSAVTVSLTASEVVYILVGGYDTVEFGAFELNITQL